MQMPSRRLPAYAATLAVPVLIAAMPAGVPSSADGLSYRWRQTSTQRGVQPIEMQVRVLEHRARIDYQKAPAGMAAGTYLLLNADSASVTMVNPREKTATVFPVGGMLSVLGSALGGIVKADFSDVSVEASDLGPGEPIFDQPTHKHNVTQRYTARVSVIGIRREVKVRSSMDIWVATDIPPAETRAMEAFARNFVGAFGSMGGFGGDGLRDLQEALLEVIPRGVHMKQVTTTIQQQGNKTDSSTTTAEMLEFSKGPIDPGIFQLASDIRVADMTASVAAIEEQRAAAKAECEKQKGVGQCEDLAPVNCDSVRKAQQDSAAAAARNDALQAAGKGAMGRLGGLLGRGNRRAVDTTTKPAVDTASKGPC
jgi:hypothetical protein